MLLLGLATGFHCVGMCGPLVITYAVQSGRSDSWASRIWPNLGYHVARTASYVFVGAILGAIGSALDLRGIRPWILVAAGAFMIVLGLGMTGRAPWAARLMPRPPKFLIALLTRMRRKAATDRDGDRVDLATPLTFGLITGFLPCAPLQGAQIVAATSGSALAGGTAMFFFALGTMPLMFAFGTTASLIPSDWRRRLNLVLAVVVIVFGLAYLDRSAVLLGSPVSFESMRAQITGAYGHADAAGLTTGTDGVPEVRIEILNDTYIPSTIAIPADRSVRLMVKRQKGDCAHNGMCAEEILIKRLGVDATLTPLATTAVALPPTRAGTYTMSSPCGMITGQIVAK
jgi:sulfite exporter TauE/SafE